MPDPTPIRGLWYDLHIYRCGCALYHAHATRGEAVAAWKRHRREKCPNCEYEGVSE